MRRGSGPCSTVATRRGRTSQRTARHAADRYDRLTIIRAAQAISAIAAIAITAALVEQALTRELLFGSVFCIGCARAFEMPTGHSLVPSP